MGTAGSNRLARCTQGTPRTPSSFLDDRFCNTRNCRSGNHSETRRRRCRSSRFARRSNRLVPLESRASCRCNRSVAVAVAAVAAWRLAFASERAWASQHPLRRSDRDRSLDHPQDVHHTRTRRPRAPRTSRAYFSDGRARRVPSINRGPSNLDALREISKDRVDVLERVANAVESPHEAHVR